VRRGDLFAAKARKQIAPIGIRPALILVASVRNSASIGCAAPVLFVLAIARHELPLSGLLGFIDLLSVFPDHVVSISAKTVWGQRGGIAPLCAVISRRRLPSAREYRWADRIRQSRLHLRKLAGA